MFLFFAVVTSLAGGSTNLVGDATGTNARFNRPWSVALDSSNNLIVADSGTHRVRKVTALGGTIKFVALSLSLMHDAAHWQSHIAHLAEMRQWTRVCGRLVCCSIRCGRELSDTGSGVIRSFMALSCFVTCCWLTSIGVHVRDVVPVPLTVPVAQRNALRDMIKCQRQVMLMFVRWSHGSQCMLCVGSGDNTCGWCRWLGRSRLRRCDGYQRRFQWSHGCCVG